MGSGPNGLAGAVTLARAGFEVTVLEEQPTIGGGMRSAELTLPGFVHDVCSGIHPLGRESPLFRELDLPVEWVDPPAAAAHPLDDGTAVMTELSLDETAVSLGEDADAYRRVVGPLVSGWRRFEPVILGPYPPSLRRLLGSFDLSVAR
ncbi:MAG TPA: NAD(P)-binding protein, partial [Gaiellaceae bacterium]|nr:NAD(P)-binding protein [Gaiellaceae bacterium]